MVCWNTVSNILVNNPYMCIIDENCVNIRYQVYINCIDELCQQAFDICTWVAWILSLGCQINYGVNVWFQLVNAVRTFFSFCFPKTNVWKHVLNVWNMFESVPKRFETTKLFETKPTVFDTCLYSRNMFQTFAKVFDTLPKMFETCL